MHVEQEQQYITETISGIRTIASTLFPPYKKYYHCDYVLQSDVLYII
jgi:hypothetical protein